MDLLKRSLAPITEEAWNAIDEQARSVLEASLSARKVADVKGPFGWDFHGWPMGRLDVDKTPFVEGAEYGTRKIQPLVEVRVPFSMGQWDLDDISRGSKTTDMGPLDEAARKIALFEEKAIYTGMKSVGVTGLLEGAENKAIAIASLKEEEEILQALAEAVMTLQNASVEGPYVLVCQKNLWKKINTASCGYPLKKRVQSMVDTIILSPMVDCSLVTSSRGGDMELVLGQDLSVGYSGTSKGKVEFFFTESFTFFIPGPEAIVPLTIK